MGPSQVLYLWVGVDMEVMTLKGVLPAPQLPRNGASPTDSVYFHIQDRFC